MILLHNFNIDIKSYSQKATNNKFPTLTQCPSCHKKYCIKRHGFYRRYVIENQFTEKVHICRYKCYSCQITISILPSFLIPYFQHTALIIATSLYYKLLKKKPHKLSRQLVSFYLKRFSSFLISFPANIKAKNIKSPIGIIKLILNLGVKTFHFASYGYQSSYFKKGHGDRFFVSVKKWKLTSDPWQDKRQNTRNCT
jgi:hypothetical protein